MSDRPNLSIEIWDRLLPLFEIKEFSAEIFSTHISAFLLVAERLPSEFPLKAGIGDKRDLWNLMCNVWSGGYRLLSGLCQIRSDCLGEKVTEKFYTDPDAPQFQEEVCECLGIVFQAVFKFEDSMKDIQEKYSEIFEPSSD